ncbi:MAG: TonB-dependent receptor, partial [Gammaproteobacteria bacterium]|nr:TonB-dependent receptor [Gammaproteobacteria bacterium]
PKYGVKAVPPQVADYTVTVGFDYSIDFTESLAASFGADYYKTDDYMTAATNDFHNDSWDLINAFVGMDFGDNWNVRLTGKNLGDETVVVSGSRSLGGFVYLPPREYLFQINYRM